MPRFASNQDARTQDAIEEWRKTARAEVDDILAWLETLDPSRCRSKPPSLFYGRTATLVGWIAKHHPGLDPAPLQAIYTDVITWHEDHNAARVPRDLFAKLEKAMMVLSIMEAAILDRCTTGAGDGNIPAEPVPKKRGRPRKLSAEDRKRDKRIVEAWKSGHYKTLAECANALGEGCTAAGVRLALDRQRKAPE